MTATAKIEECLWPMLDTAPFLGILPLEQSMRLV